MLNAKVVADAIDRLALMPGFPFDDGAKMALGKILDSLCSTDAQVTWLAGRVPELFDRWPGEFDVRAVFCSKYKPRTGKDIGSRAYPDGIPSENPEPYMLPPAREHLRITGEVEIVSEDEQANALVRTIGTEKAMVKVSKIELERSRRFFEERGIIGL